MDSNAASTFLVPFEVDSWIALGIFLLIVAGLFILFLNTSCNETFILLVQIMTSQGGGEPRRESTKVAIFVIFILVVILLNFYSSVLLNVILSPPKDHFSNLQQLITSTDMHLSRISTFVVKAFLDFRLKEFNRTVKEIQFNEEPPQNLDLTVLTVFDDGLRALKLMNQGRLAFAADSSTAEGVMRYFLSPNEICELRSKVFLNRQYSLVLTKESSFFEMFQIATLKLRESGVFHRQYKHFIPSMADCQAGVSLYSVPFGKVATAFYILIGKCL